MLVKRSSIVKYYCKNVYVYVHVSAIKYLHMYMEVFIYSGLTTNIVRSTYNKV